MNLTYLEKKNYFFLLIYTYTIKSKNSCIKINKIPFRYKSNLNIEELNIKIAEYDKTSVCR